MVCEFLFLQFEAKKIPKLISWELNSFPCFEMLKNLSNYSVLNDVRFNHIKRAFEFAIKQTYYTINI